MDSEKRPSRFFKIACAVLGLLLFILGLKTIVGGTAALRPFFETVGVHDLHGALAFGWLMACAVLSGSPVAATALAIHDRAALDSFETFGMITGSRLGAAFVVLLIGFIYDLRGKKGERSVYVGAVALLTTMTIYLPAMVLGIGLLSSGFLERVRFGFPGFVNGLLDQVYGPPIGLLKAILPPWLMTPAGIAILLAAFRIFDKILPEVDPTHGKVSRMATVVYKPMVTFLLGMLVTSITLSVSVSVSILVPLTAKGYVRRENLIPYIMGANITTFIDTLFASLLMESRDAFSIVLAEIFAVSAVSLPIILFAYGPYEHIIDHVARYVTKDRRRLAISVIAFLAVPLVLLVI